MKNLPLDHGRCLAGTQEVSVAVPIDEELDLALARILRVQAVDCESNPVVMYGSGGRPQDLIAHLRPVLVGVATAPRTETVVVETMVPTNNETGSGRLGEEKVQSLVRPGEQGDDDSSHNSRK